MLHTVGLALVVGPNAVLDLRVLGAAPRLPIDALRPVFRVMVIGFVINASTGLVLFVSEAAEKGLLWVFYVKLSLIALALIAAWRTRRLIFGADGSTTVREIPASAKALAILSLVLWTGAIVAGRLMAYVH
jgi:hypothetical protein